MDKLLKQLDIIQVELAKAEIEVEKTGFYQIEDDLISAYAAISRAKKR